MKKMKKILVVVAVLMPFLLQAQSPLDKVAYKYSGKKGFNAVNISKDMLQLFVSMADEKDTATQAFKRSITHMNNMKVISCNRDSVKTVPALAFFKEATAAFDPAIYPELITGNDGYEDIRFLAKKNPQGQITELVMLEIGAKEIVAFSITGIIDLATVSKIAKEMDIKGADELKKVKTKSKK